LASIPREAPTKVSATIIDANMWDKRFIASVVYKILRKVTNFVLYIDRKKYKS